MDDRMNEQASREIHIFVNRRRFGPEDGVKQRMTGLEIAALVGAAVENAVVREGPEPGGIQIGLSDTIIVHTGQHFLVTRRTVEGGARGDEHRAH